MNCSAVMVMSDSAMRMFALGSFGPSSDRARLAAADFLRKLRMSAFAGEYGSSIGCDIILANFPLWKGAEPFRKAIRNFVN